jgi:hypothetical protein
MAFRDRSQGFAFVYVDLAKLLRERDQFNDNADAPVYGPEEKAVNFNKDPRPAGTPPPTLVEDISTSQTQERNVAVRQIKDNLDRLQNLHHKLHAMLEDLNKATDTKKKKN